MFEVATLLVLAAVGAAIVWWGSIRLEDAANALAAAYGLPTVVQGAVLAAVGSSLPDAFVSIAAARAD